MCVCRDLGPGGRGDPGCRDVASVMLGMLSPEQVAGSGTLISTPDPLTLWLPNYVA